MHFINFVHFAFSATEMKKLDVPCNIDEAELKTLLWQTFPRLDNKDFHLCRVDRFRHVCPLSSSRFTPMSLRRELGRSALYIQPKVICSLHACFCFKDVVFILVWMQPDHMKCWFT